jgi:hypothetical protein
VPATDEKCHRGKFNALPVVAQNIASTEGNNIYGQA